MKAVAPLLLGDRFGHRQTVRQTFIQQTSWGMKQEITRAISVSNYFKSRKVSTGDRAVLHPSRVSGERLVGGASIGEILLVNTQALRIELVCYTCTNSVHCFIFASTNALP